MRLPSPALDGLQTLRAPQLWLVVSGTSPVGATIPPTALASAMPRTASWSSLTLPEFVSLANETKVTDLTIWEPILSYAKCMELGIHKIASV